jgi:hypothetical protein
VPFAFWAVWLSTVSAFAESTNETNAGWGIPLAAGKAAGGTTINRYGVPFVAGTLAYQSNGLVRVKVGGQAKRIFLLGMTDTGKPHSWTALGTYSRRYFIGDEMGVIRLDYVDGSKQTFPLVYGDSLWWGGIFYTNPEPYLSDAHLRQALQNSLRLYPATPLRDGNYVAVIIPKDRPIEDIVVQKSPAKVGVPVIAGITVESTAGEKITNGIELPGYAPAPELEKFAAEKPLCPRGVDTNEIQAALENLRRAVYVSTGEIKGRVAAQKPEGYSGPDVSFSGDVYATILGNVFYANVQDIRNKIDVDGMYHTSTKGAPNWSYYSGFGTYATNVGCYYNDSWTRDMGRSLQELSALGYTNEALRCADYCLRTARLWENPTNAFHGQILPPHWGRIANKPQSWCVFENDGHGLTAMFLYRLWQRLPNRNEWLQARWPDVKAAGDWILWQFDHPEISGATNGILFTTSESAGMVGYSVYPDYTCMSALWALADMADSVGQTNPAAQWRARADEMRSAIIKQYTINDPKYDRVWTLAHAGWPNKSTVLGPLILVADYKGFAPEDDDPAWHPVNQAAYERLINTYQPFGFYGLAMGYGQGLVTQASLLLDRMHDASQMLNWAAKEIYDPRFGSFIVPEACDIDPSGRYLYRMGDLGNGVQEAELVKMLRLVIGVDDTHPNRLRFYPRMPYDWNKITVSRYPVLFDHTGKTETALLHYQLQRSTNGMELKIGADQALGPVAMRLGPFEDRPEISTIRVNGQNPTGALVEHSGDSWWVRFAANVGLAK